MDQFQVKQIESWQQVCIERELYNGSVSEDKGCNSGNRKLDNGSVAEESECKVGSKCVARAFGNG